MANITVPDKVTGSPLTAAEFQQILDALKNGTLSTNTEYLTLKAGTAAAGTAPIKLTTGVLLTTPESGALEYTNGKFYITNKDEQKALDRTSDVALETVTVVNNAAETTIYTYPMAAGSMEAGNVLKLHASGVVSNKSGTAANEVVLRYKIGGVLIATLETNTASLTDAHWSLNSLATQRTIGAGGKRARDMVLQVGDPTSDGDQVFVNNISDIDTTANMDIIITVQWANDEPENSISLLQASLEYKN